MAGNKPNTRPRAPHLQVYKWGPAMAVSILHRDSGDGLAIVGACLFLWWLGAIAAGPDAYAAFVACIWHHPSPEIATTKSRVWPSPEMMGVCSNEPVGVQALTTEKSVVSAGPSPA